MIFIWSTNGKAGSRLIRWGLGHDCSHFAVGFFEEDEARAVVVESRLDGGVLVCPLSNFLHRNKVVHILQAPSTRSEDCALYDDLTKLTKGMSYDYPAILYWLWVGICRKFFGIEGLDKNLLDQENMLYCVEVLSVLSHYLSELGVEEDDFSMVAPHEAYELLSESGAFREIRWKV